MTSTHTGDLSYDPYDVEIDADPYPVFARLRDEAPLYYNEQHDFYALSRYDDVERALVDRDTYISGRGGILEMIKAGIEMPPGILIFEDPPTHTIHRGLLSRVFTPRQVNGLEPKIREFCARSLDPLVGETGFDFVADLGRADADARDRHAPRDPRGRPGSGRATGATPTCARSRASRSRCGRTSSTARCSPSTSTGGPSTRPTTS